MAHIASCVAGLEPSPSPKPSSSVPSTTPPPSPPDKPYAWRMRSEAPRKYQLFPKGRPSPSNNNASLDPEKAFALVMGQNSDRTSPTSGLKIRINQQNVVRRRKISVPEPGPMTTVQEATMDSPTIPGRPPLRERSISAALEDGCKHAEPTQPPSNPQTLNDTVYLPSKPLLLKRKPVGSPPRLPSPRTLAPLIIPKTTSGPLPPESRRPSPFRHVGSDSTPPVGISQFARFENSPMRYQSTPTTSMPDLSTYPLSASTDIPSATMLPTPVSAPIMMCRPAAKPWEGYGQSPLSAAQVKDGLDHGYGHRRFASESSSIMDRGRPTKRTHMRNTSSPQPGFSQVKRSKSAERRAFEELPQGWKPGDAVNQMSANDIAILRQQALGQAMRFEVLRVEDVEALSRELRQLDERTEYLRRTYNSLRSGRRNLHSRICHYLRSPRVARFSHESMLKQEEALAELDASIDDWVIKLERAENRRTRVRQKLLEHVAAASALPAAGDKSFLQSLPSGPRDISTPPRSPTKPAFSSRVDSILPSPQRVVAQVPSTILELPSVEETEEEDKAGMLSRKSTLKRSDVESIRIYAGDGLLSLITDVEEAIFRMSCAPENNSDDQPESQRMEQDRQRSHKKPIRQPDLPILTMEPTITAAPPKPTTVPPMKPTTGTAASPVDLIAAVRLSPLAPTPPRKDSPKETEFFLTSAVFKPQ